MKSRVGRVRQTGTGNGNGNGNGNTNTDVTVNEDGTFTPTDSAILHELKVSGKVDGRDIQTASQIVALRRRLMPLTQREQEQVHVGHVMVPSTPETEVPAQPVNKQKRTIKLTPEQLESRQLQGRYLGLYRQLKPRARAHAQKMAKDVGREKAVAWMRRELGK